MKQTKQAVTLRLTPDAIAIIKRFSEQTGLSQADIVELALRAFDNNAKVELPKK